MNVHEFTALNERLKAKQAELFDHLTQDPRVRQYKKTDEPGTQKNAERF